jgi:hypothetical protein
MSFVGVVKDGKVELPPEWHVPDGTPVKIEVVSNGVDPLDRLLDFSIDAEVDDLAAEHDHYAYGTAKRGSH